MRYPSMKETIMRDEDQPWYQEWLATGTVECQDCGTRVRCANLESLPAHGCVQRQQARRAKGGTNR